MDILLLTIIIIILLIILALNKKVEKLEVSVDHLFYRIEEKESGEE